MKLIKTSNGQRIKMSRSEWENIGKKAGWMKVAELTPENNSLGDPQEAKAKAQKVIDSLGLKFTGDFFSKDYGGVNVTGRFVVRANGQLSLGNIWVPEEARGGGIGNQFMNELVNAADRENVEIVLVAETGVEDEYSKGLKQKQLESWYRKFGFEVYSGLGADVRMIRKPNVR